MGKTKTPGDKLLKLREWVTVPEAAKHLSVVLDEEVGEADVLRLALDRHLKLSVLFVNHAYAKRGKELKTIEEWRKKTKKIATWKVLEPIFARASKPLLTMELLDKLSHELQPALISSIIDQAKNDHQDISATFKGKVRTIEGVWDLPMVGSERLDIENRYQVETDGPPVTLVYIDGALVENGEGVVFQLQDTFDQEYFEYRDSEERKKDSFDYYAKALEKKMSNNEIDKNEAERLLKQRKENIYTPRKWDDNFFPAGALPRDSVLVVRTKALRDFLGNLLSDSDAVKEHQDDPLFDPKFPFHAKELKIAVEAWTELYENNPPQSTPQGGHKKYITQWLESYYPELSGLAKKRIASVVNPNPKGGASPTAISF